MNVGQRLTHVKRLSWQVFLIPAAVLALTIPQITDLVGTPAMIIVGSVALSMALTVHGRVRAWIIYAVGFALGTKIRAIAATTGVPVHFEYGPVLDGLLPGPGPTNWMQHNLRAEVIDRYALLVYSTYFFVPWVFMAVISWRKPELVGRFAIAFLIMLGFGLVVFFTLPTAPPWMAAQHGDLPGVKPLILTLIGRTSTYSYGQSVAGENPVAAMPSFHMATIFLIFLACTFRRRWAIPFAIYSASMAFSLVYLGEHYIADEIAGCLIAWAAWWIAGFRAPSLIRSAIHLPQQRPVRQLDNPAYDTRA